MPFVGDSKWVLFPVVTVSLLVSRREKKHFVHSSRTWGEKQLLFCVPLNLYTESTLESLGRLVDCPDTYGCILDHSLEAVKGTGIDM
jgi:hypothetical protein